jgi:tripartite-type tricarboxylate transporter receptor subunit TctC
MKRFCVRACGVMILMLQMQLPALALYPDRPVRIVAPVAAGGGVDVLARLIAQRLNGDSGQKFYVENKPGAGGVIGSHLVIGSPPDGYNLLFTPSSLSLAVAVRKTPPYDVAKDFTPVIAVAITPYALVVNKSLPVKTVQELIAYAKANPGKLSYSSAGIGSASHLAAELFKTMAGIEMVHIPNKGVNPAIVDLIGGQVQVMFAGLPAIQAQKDVGRLNLLGLAEAKRSTLMPELPTIAEQGFHGFETNNWVALLGPAGLEPAIVAKLHGIIADILSTNQMKEDLKTLGYDLVAGTPSQFGEQMKADVARWSTVVDEAHIPRN